MLTVRGQLRGQAHQHNMQPTGSQMHSLTGCNWQAAINSAHPHHAVIHFH